MSIEIVNIRKTKPCNPYDFIVDRTSPVGNPYGLSGEEFRDCVCDNYKKYFQAKILSEDDSEFKRYLGLILDAYLTHGKVRLFCWCAPKRCHAATIAFWIENSSRGLLQAEFDGVEGGTHIVL